mmetsp:Transcript_11320/g.15674  ORF Transcript_11320/g.15674 Transcript_11320/m.15674 type:complete len:269 (+) Transcript_11320:71-877(+)|eukprot:CAMPEP_0185263602 /NCGR_PEP_ID=MMETSP1359-20130426/15324_1 /TAXON_ID=552665 /ORGANISM="Bigelowiella longifila, Strain CCMP242" /LENGTH=268 /DNA_ID=CAMNT_0027851235 /DNA_START=71 /DNA_END=877 /DNA_ORIENTATION=+
MAAPNTLPLPNNTVYVNNLNEKVKIVELQKALTHVFTQFGNILEVQASKALKKRGQAWVVFDSKESAEKCIKEMNGFNFYDKPLRINFAKSKSDIIAKRDGTYVERPKKPMRNKKKKRMKKRKQEAKDSKSNGKKKKVKSQKPGAPSGMAPSMPANGRGPPPAPSNLPPSVPMQMNNRNGRPAMSFPPRQAAGPNRILFIEHLPEDVKMEEIDILFNTKPGFKETRVINVRGVAFVEFDTDYLAGLALGQVAEATVRGEKLRISYAKS